MIILTQGDVHKNIRWVIDKAWKCESCGTVIQIEPKDFNPTDSGDMREPRPYPPKVKITNDQRDGKFFLTRCPKCGNQISGHPGDGLPLPPKQTYGGDPNR